ncbi:MAG TPA: multicopper oxidase domain-containing protein [Ktedonobacterales bacterium]|nr:multicopper oxidase domain-containing protein [Ktedonobacterales bacterium]
MSIPEVKNRAPEAPSSALEKVTDKVTDKVAPETPVAVTSAAPARYEPAHEPTVDTSSRAITAEESLAEWWSKQHGLRMVMTQLVLTLMVLLIVLPLGSLLGWFGARTAAPASGQNSGSQMSSGQTTSNSPSPNAPTHPLYDPQLSAAPQGNVVNVSLVAKPARIAIASGIAYDAWTFNGTVPGPVVHVRQGQTIHFTLTNGDTAMSHSIDFHAAQTPWNVNYQPVAPGQSFSFDWVANYPGAFLYHCGVPPVMEHMANGMYGAIIVDPANGWATPAQEYVLVQSEFYTQRAANGDYVLSNSKMMEGMPDYVTFNGYANQYSQAPLTAKPGERIRLFIVNAGPSRFSAFHVIGALFSDYYPDGNPANLQQGNQTITVPPGGGAVVELTMSEAGTYPFVTHSFMDASIGAAGAIKVAP